MITSMMIWILMNISFTTKPQIEYIYLDTTYIVAHSESTNER